jgi:hypothetical protein
MKDLPDYENLKHGFNQLLFDHSENAEEGRKAIIVQAVKMIQATKEPRPKRAKTKKRGGR